MNINILRYKLWVDESNKNIFILLLIMITDYDY